MSFVKLIKSKFGQYDTGYEYWVNIKDINIPKRFRAHKIGEAKWRRKWKYLRKYGLFESNIILTKNFQLVDGYSSIRIAEINGMKKVPVYFVE